MLLSQSLKLVVEDVEHQPRIEFRVIDMASLEAAVVIMLNKVVVRIARECQRVEPEGIYWCGEHCCHLRPLRQQVRQIMTQDVVTHHVFDTRQTLLKAIKF